MCAFFVARQCFIPITVVRTIGQWEDIGIIYVYSQIINFKYKKNRFSYKETKARRAEEDRGVILCIFVFITFNSWSSYSDLLSLTMPYAPSLQWWQKGSNYNYCSLKVNIKFPQTNVINCNPYYFRIFIL